MKLYKLALAPFLFLAVACGEDGTSIDLNGKTPEQQAETVADASCDAQVACGQLGIDIAQDGETITCTATFEDVDYDECVAEFEPDALEVFQNCDLSDEDLATIEACFNADLPCISQSDADAYCDEVEAGNEPEFPGDVPQACEDMQAIIEDCSSPQ